MYLFFRCLVQKILRLAMNYKKIRECKAIIHFLFLSMSKPHFFSISYSFFLPLSFVFSYIIDMNMNNNNIATLSLQSVVQIPNNNNKSCMKVKVHTLGIKHQVLYLVQNHFIHYGLWNIQSWEL